MFGSSVAAFYSMPKWLFYRLDDIVWRNKFAILLLRLQVNPQPEAVVHRANEVLLAAKISLGRLHGCTPQQELNLLQLAAAIVAQLRARSAQVVARNVLQAHSLSQQVLTTYQTTFCEMSFPHIFPVLATARKIFPSVILAASIH